VIPLARILHLVPALFGQNGVHGGGERFAFELARHMACVVPTKLVTFGKTPQRFSTVEGLKVEVLAPAWKVRDQEFNPLHIGLVRAVAESNIIHTHQTNILASECAALLGRMFGRKVFTSDLGGGGWCLGARANTSSWFHGHLHISEYSRRLACRENDSRHRVILGGVDTDKYSPSSEVIREPLVVFVGRLLPHKGVDVLVQDLPPGLTLELIGRPYSDAYLARLRELAVGKRVLFRMDCDDKELVRAYRRAACVVLPSVYRDCYGNETKVPELLGQTPLEAMACGAPAIVTNVASLPEVVVDGETGFIVPPNDPVALRTKLEWIRDHPRESRAMGNAGREWVLKQFTWSAVVQHCLNAYKTIK
jgi:glycosyltransferase involved in cell wall biosynthesis